MISRATIVVFGCLLTSAVHAAPDLYVRGEQFAEPPRNWRQTFPTQFYGWEPTNVTGGRGAAGGLLLPTRYLNRYADLFLNGALDRNMPFSSGGQVALLRASGRPPFITTAYVGHFSQRFNRYVNTVGVAFNGVGADVVECQAVIQFADGTAFVGESFQLALSRDARSMKWSCDWDPTGGKPGRGRLTVKVNGNPSIIDVPASADGRDFALDAFGIFQPYFGAPDSNSFLQMYIGGLAYTAFAGTPPVVKIRGPRRITTAQAVVDLRGATNVSMGNRVAKVRYRVHRAGKPTRYRNATGTDKWTAAIRVPRGNSRIEILARSDSGLVGTREVRVRRRN